MGDMQQVEVVPVPLERLAPLLPPERVERMDRYAAMARDGLAGRTVWNLNSTAHGGGVAEMLHTLVAYALGTGVDVRWLVVGGDPDFFTVTKRIHNWLHGVPGDHGALDEAARAAYDDTLARQRDEVLGLVQPGDVVLLHDPQTVGLAEPLRAKGAVVVWRCHVGLDERNEWTRGAWDFLRGLVEPAHACVFSREEFAPEWLDRSRLRIIPPSLDPFSPKNTALGDQEVEDLVHRDGLVVEGDPLSTVGRAVLQVSRWDRLKDMAGVLEAFADTSTTCRATPISCSPVPRRAAWPTTRRPPRCWRSVAACGARCREAARHASTCCPCPWPTPTRTPGSSTPCSAGRRWSSRRAWPRASA